MILYSVIYKMDNSIPIYISLTSIYKNQNILLLTLKSLINQSLKPTQIYLYLSQFPFLLDSGFPNRIITDNALQKFININKNNITIKWVNNIGSYRKLIPLLKEKWQEDCIIITVDDDIICNKNLIKNLVYYYNIHKCVIGNRGFTPKFDSLYNFNYQTRFKTIQKYAFNFLTGCGGILYKPEFFHKTGQLIFNENIFLKTCRTQDDIWFYVLRIANKINAFITNNNWTNSHYFENLNQEGLFFVYNKHQKNNNKLPCGLNNNLAEDLDPNTKALRNTLILLKNNLT